LLTACSRKGYIVLTDRSPLTVAANWLEDNWSSFFLIVGAIGLALAGVLVSKEHDDLSWLYSTSYGRWFSIASLLSCTGGVGSIKKDLSTSQLREKSRRVEQDRKTFSEILPDELWVLSNKVLKFGVTERVSVFRYINGENGNTTNTRRENEEVKGCFILLAREAQNPMFQRPGRKIYSEDQGVVGLVLHHGQFMCDGAPDPNTNPSDYYVWVQRNLKISEEVAKLRTMQARSYAGFRINDFNNKFAGVIVFESSSPQGLNFQTLETVMGNEECDRLARLLERSKPFEPKPLVALKGGY
jgi:hypothetical protein